MKTRFNSAKKTPALVAGVGPRHENLGGVEAHYTIKMIVIGSGDEPTRPFE